jgi:FKBP-type peptidyl-prolyl cis-trans isomerase
MMKLSLPIVAACLLAVVACNKPAASVANPTTTGGATGGPGGKPVKQGISTLKALTKEDVKVGDGTLLGIKVGNPKPVENGDLISLEYKGTLGDGKTFDTNFPGVQLNGAVNEHAKPLVFYVGRGSVVPGLDQGVLGMHIGGERKVGIPPALGYGAEPQGDPDNPSIPANSDLHFDVKLLDIVKPGEEGVFDYKDVSTGSGRAIKSGDTVQIEYTVKLADGTVVDTNVGKDRPYEFTIGELPPKVIAGMEQGVSGMKLGGVRLLRVPPGIGYGTKMVAGIPPNSTLVIQVKVLELM